MTEWLLGLVPQYGIWLLAISTFLSCLALPIPASLLMLAAGGFASAGDLSLTGSIAGALTGAVAGDQVGFAAGRAAGGSLIGNLGKRAAPIAKAAAMLAQRGGAAVFLSRWLFSALGPYMNVASGAVGLDWQVFTFWGVAGEIVWVTLYVGVGYAVTGNLADASAVALDIVGLLAAGAVAVGLFAWLLALVRSEARQ